MPIVWKMTSTTVHRKSGGRHQVLPFFVTVFSRRSVWAFVVVFVAIALLGSPAWPAGTTAKLGILMQKHQDAHRMFAAEMETAATTCDAAQLVELAAEIRQLALPLDQQPGNVDNLPTRKQLEIPTSLPADERAAKVRVRKLRSDYAVALYGLVRKALDDQHSSFAYRLIREVLFHDPDHALARKVLGYQLADNEWTTPFAIQMKREGRVWHDEFGWIPSKHVPRYAAGQRYYNNTWMTAEKEETIRSDFSKGWEVETEHFKVKTNYSQNEGAHLAAAVEVFHRYFMREFAAFFYTPQQQVRLFEGTHTKKKNAPHEIHHYRLRQEFVNRLAKECPVATLINGIYMPKERTAFFFHNPEISREASLETLYHEVTHQLLSECTRQKIPVGHEHDFWVIEGIACYFESFRVADDGTISVGDTGHPRIQSAREQVVVTQDQEPLVRLTAYGMLAFQKPEQITQRYAQAAGLTHFLMHYQDGIYRDGFIEFLAQIYSPDERVRGKKTLAEILGVSNAVLDTQYAAYFRAMEKK